MSIKEYIQDLAKNSGMDAELSAQILKGLENEKFAKELEGGIKRQSDYSRNMDELKAKETKVDQTINQWREWYNTAVANDAAREEELVRLRGGAASTATLTRSEAVAGVSKKELQEAQGNLVNIMKQAMKISSGHAAKFGEALDTDMLEKIAVEKGLTLDRAYDELVRPRVEESRQKEFEEKIKLAREEGMREGLSKRDLPGEGEKAPFHPIFGYSKAVEATKGLTGQQRVSSFEEAWNSAGNKK